MFSTCTVYYQVLLLHLNLKRLITVAGITLIFTTGIDAGEIIEVMPENGIIFNHYYRY